MAEHSTAEEGTFQKVKLLSKSLNNTPEDNVVFLNGQPVYMAKPLTVVRSAPSTGNARVLAPPLTKEGTCSEAVMETQVEEPERSQRSGLKNPKTPSFSQDSMKSAAAKRVDALRSEKLESRKRDEEVEVLKVNPFAGLNLKRPSREKVAEEQKKKGRVEEKIPSVEDGEFPREAGRLLVGGRMGVASSTVKGVTKLVDNEIININFFPTSSYKSQSGLLASQLSVL